MKASIRYVRRAETLYAGISVRTARQRLGEKVFSALAEVMAFLTEHGMSPSGPPLIRYRVVDYDSGNVQVDIGMPIGQSGALPSSSRVRHGQIPGGQFGSVTHHGSYEALVSTTAAFLRQARDSGVIWDSVDRDAVTEWAARVEHYRIAPADDPIPENWRTDIEVLTARS